MLDDSIKEGSELEMLSMLWKLNLEACVAESDSRLGSLT
jgi:hypothetical protein